MIQTTPDFTTPPLDTVAGVRPWRENGYRLEGKPNSANPRKFIIHNYGHGGAGITLSWGVASQVRDLVADRTKLTGDTAVAVLGSGAIGLTAATLIRALGLEVTIYASEFWEKTTSRVAGAQWAPSSVKYSDEAKFKDVLKTAYTRFASDIGKGFGVSKRLNYTPERDPYLDLVEDLVPGLIPKAVPMNLPFEHLTAPGFAYETLLIETPIFLKKLDADLRGNNVEFKRKTFTNVASVLGLQENVIVNCTGLGSKDIWTDPKLIPIKGHLALLKPQPALTYLFSRSGYLFPRADAVVIGGTYRVGDATTNPDPNVSKQLVDHMKGVFGVGPVVPVPLDHFDHPDNRLYVATELVAGDV
jgi:D-amino-acid oxidase